MRRLDGCRPTSELSVATACQQTPCRECQVVQNRRCQDVCCFGDCDDLPDERDPWPTHCNELVFFDDFCKVDLEKWDHSSNVEVTQPGLADFVVSPGNTYWVGARAPDSHGALVEARLESLSGGPDWQLWVSADGASPQSLPTTTFRMCVLSAEDGSLTLWSEITASQGWQVGQPAAISDLDPAQGMILQNWLDGQSHYCRVVQGARSIVTEPHALPGEFAATNQSVAVGMLNAFPTAVTAKLDFVRVFAPPR